MECPHLGSSVCIVPDSAKFPQGSPSSWCCSGECGLRRAALPARGGPAVLCPRCPAGEGSGARGRAAAPASIRRGRPAGSSEEGCAFQPPLRPRGSFVSRPERGLLSHPRPCPGLPAQRCPARGGQRTLSRRGRRSARRSSARPRSALLFSAGLAACSVLSRDRG